MEVEPWAKRTQTQHSPSTCRFPNIKTNERDKLQCQVGIQVESASIQDEIKQGDFDKQGLR